MKSSSELFLTSYQTYLKTIIDNSLQQSEEVRIISQSMMPSHVLAIFLHIQALYGQLSQIKSYLKVANGLIEHWQTLNLDEVDSEALNSLEANGWLDKEDKLTWYRNRTTKDENVEKLLIFLVGIDYTTDKGGLADFFVVNDDKIWESVGSNYKLWLKIAIDQQGKLIADKVIQQLNDYLIQVNKAVPMSLSQKSEFIEQWLGQVNELTTDDELLISLFKLLPSYGIPYLAIENDLKDFRAKKGLEYLRASSTFISHANYKSPSRKKGDFQKIEKLFTETPDLVLIDVSGNIINNADYLAQIKEFIFNANKEAKNQLIEGNLLPALKALKIKEDTPKTTNRNIPLYESTSLEAILRGINHAISSYRKDYDVETISNIQIKVENFQHDFSHSEAEDLNKDTLAKAVLSGVLGGIEPLLSTLDLPENIAINFVPLFDNDNKPTFNLVTSSKRPQVNFEVTITGDETEIFPFKWRLSEYQIERLHIQLAKVILNKIKDKKVYLPIIELPADIFKAIYYASNKEEACRLLSLGLNAIEVRDVFENYPIEHDSKLSTNLEQLGICYQEMLSSVLHQGRYATTEKMKAFCQQYIALGNYLKTLDGQVAKDVSRRFYYAFCMTEKVEHFNIHNIEQIIVNGFHPAMLELIIAQTNFIMRAIENKFQVSNLPELGTKDIDDIFIQSEIKSPILALKQRQGITTHHKSFDWLHFIGKQPQGEVDLYVQSLLQEAEQEYEEDVQTIENSAPEQDIIINVLNDYQEGNNHANDGLRILATNVTKLSSLLAGINKFFDKALDTATAISDFYSLNLTVYTNHLSKLATINTLKSFQNNLIELFAKKDKVLKVNISHFMSSPILLNNDLKNLATKQRQTNFGRFDVAFNFNFLESKANGSIEVAPTIEEQVYDENLIFPIIYYPKPIFKQYENTRDIRLSQRQIKVQSSHTYLTTTLNAPIIDQEKQYFVLSKMEYEPNDIEVIERLHEVAQWVVNIDEYFDHYLLKKSNDTESEQKRKVISFSSGYGNYGELNVTLSTAHHAYERLKRSVEAHLSSIMPYLHKPMLPKLAEEVLKLNEGLSGVANVKSILGEGETIRNLYGYALAMKHIKPKANAILSEWIPLDAYPHWFKGAEKRPDLLQLSLTINENNEPFLFAHVVESKVGSSALLPLAEDQIEVGLKHLMKLFAPKSVSQGYDRRYWWGQMYRALITRAIVEEVNTTAFSIALEKLTEGDFEIHWQSSIVLCKTGFNEEIQNSTERKFLSDFFSEAERTYTIHEFSELDFEKKLLDWIDWTTVTRELPQPQVTATKVAEPTNPTSTEQLGFDDLFTTENEAQVTQPVVSNTEEQAIENNPVALPQTDLKQHQAEVVTTPQIVEPITAVQQPVVATEPSANPLPQTATAQPVLANDRPILIGTNAVGSSHTPYYWAYNHAQLNNRHMLIFGSSGSGKTYAIQCILSELAMAGISSFIIDYTDGFLIRQSQPIYQKICNPKEYTVDEESLPINPLKLHSYENSSGNIRIEKPLKVAIRVRNILTSIYKEFGTQQEAIVDKILDNGLTENPNYSLHDFLNDLEESGSRGEGVADKIRTLVRLEAFDTEAESNIYEEEIRNQYAVQVIQLTQIPSKMQRMITEFILWDLWAYVQKHGHKDKPITIVLDEMQNLDHRADSPIDKLLREGRKFGISLILATQTISNFTQEQKDRLFQASTKLFFKPATTEVDSFASLLTKVHPNLSKNEWVEQLNGLSKGQCFFIGNVEDVKGNFKEVVAKLDVTALENRFHNINNF